MPRIRRYLPSGQVYEACIRAKEGLPFAALGLITTILEGAMARAQRDSKITICHFIWMANHLHILFIVHDAWQCSAFFCELQKKITDAMKKLLGIEHLLLWEGRPSIVRILDAETATQRIAYFYCNPAKANLVESIEHYPGLSSWGAFSSAPQDLSAKVSKEVPWYRSRYLPVLDSRSVSARRDKGYLEELRRRKHRLHNLEIYPNAWMKVFEIAEAEEVKGINLSIVENVKDTEKSYAAERRAKRIGVMGPTALASTPILKPHKPKKSRRIYFISFIKELRLQAIAEMQDLGQLCRELYLAARCGARVDWPPGVFPPRGPMLANAILR
jgi:hypothetical protein